MEKKKEVVTVVTDYTPSELRVAAEFLTNWLPFLTTNLCTGCSRTLRDRVASLHPDFSVTAQQIPLKEIHRDYETNTRSLGSWEDQANGCSHIVPDTYAQSISDSNSLGRWKNDTNEYSCVPDFSERYWSTDSLGSWEDNAIACSRHVPYISAKYWNTDSIDNWKNSAIDCLCHVPKGFPAKAISGTNLLGISNDHTIRRSEYTRDISIDSQIHHNPMSGTDAEENELGVENDTTISTTQNEYLRFKMVKRKKRFSCMRNIDGRRVNIVDGLELHTCVFSAAEQKEIVDFIYTLEEKGRKRELKELTFSAPKKWMPGKGRVTIQFGCCYNYATMKDGTPPGILRNELVDPIPDLFKVMIRRLVHWHILPPTCVPDSCIVNIYEEGDCIPPHIDHHDFLRPFCTVSFLSECNIVFGSHLKVVGPAEFSGQVAIPLPLGSVLVLNGNGADVAKHCVPAVPTKRISITFRKMNEAKRPIGFIPEPDLQDLQPLQFDVCESKILDAPESPPQVTRHSATKEFDPKKGIWVSSRDFSVTSQQMPLKEIHCDCESDEYSLGSWKGVVNGCSQIVPDISAQNISDSNSLGTWKDDTNECSRLVPDVSAKYWDIDSLCRWKDNAMEYSLHVPDAVAKDISDTNSLDIVNGYTIGCSEYSHDISTGDSPVCHTPMPGIDAEENEHELENDTTLSTAQKEYLRFKMVKRKKDFICMRNIDGRRVNIVDGLELHTGVFSAAEQKEIVNFICTLEEKGRKGELKELTFSAPRKWMPGKGRVTIQFGCCYNYATKKDGTPPGILRDKLVDPIPDLFKAMIRRLVHWHILPPTCVPDSCIVNIYEEGDCIPPHIDHHDFLRPFCTVSFLSECNIVFGSSLKVVGPAEFSGQVAIPLPLGSVLVLNGNGADIAKHCVPAVPTKRISITFRKMDEAKLPTGFVPEPDLQDLQPLQFDASESASLDAPKSPQVTRHAAKMEFDPQKGIWVSSSGGRSNSHYSNRTLTPKPKPYEKGLPQTPVRDFDSEKGRNFYGDSGERRKIYGSRGNRTVSSLSGQSMSSHLTSPRLRISLRT